MRRECEERFELTEALSQAREQLLELRRSGGSLPCSLNKGALTYPATAVSNHRERSSVRQNCGRGTNTTSLHGLPKPAASLTPDKLKKVISAGLPTLPQTYPPKGRASSVNETRQRLTAILSRRLSQQWWPKSGAGSAHGVHTLHSLPETHCSRVPRNTCLQIYLTRNVKS